MSGVSAGECRPDESNSNSSKKDSRFAFDIREAVDLILMLKELGSPKKLSYMKSAIHEADAPWRSYFVRRFFFKVYQSTS